MTDELQQILCDLIERHGRELVREPKRLEGMLNDACAGQHRGARRVLVDAVQERVVEELLALGPSEQVEVVVGRAQHDCVDSNDSDGQFRKTRTPDLAFPTRKREDRLNLPTKAFQGKSWQNWTDFPCNRSTQSASKVFQSCLFACSSHSNGNRLGSG